MYFLCCRLADALTWHLCPLTCLLASPASTMLLLPSATPHSSPSPLLPLPPTPALSTQAEGTSWSQCRRPLRCCSTPHPIPPHLTSALIPPHLTSALSPPHLTSAPPSTCVPSANDPLQMRTRSVWPLTLCRSLTGASSSWRQCTPPKVLVGWPRLR